MVIIIASSFGVKSLIVGFMMYCMLKVECFFKFAARDASPQK